MDEAFYAIERNWGFIYVNAGAEDFWGRRREYLLGRSMLERFRPSLVRESHAAHVAAMASGERSRVETVSTVTRTPVELRLRPTPWGLLLLPRYHERRETERALRA